MKVYANPIEFKNDYSADFKKWSEDERVHKAAVKAWLEAKGFNGKDTGKVISFGVADGGAHYMFGDKGAKSVLIHLPYGDAYQYPDVKFLPVAEIRRRLNAQEKFNSIFDKQAA